MMELNQPVVISIAGLDPSAGAGLLADVKTIEANGCLAMGVSTAITFQNDSEFSGLKWLSADNIIQQLNPLVKRYHCKVFKIGIISSLETLQQVVDFIYSTCKNPFIIWDPVLSASAGFTFIEKTDKESLTQLLKKISLITPNLPEIQNFWDENDTLKSASLMSQFCIVYLKGGHDTSSDSINDYLFDKGECIQTFTKNKIEKGDKHGSGCVLSSAIAANYAQSKDIVAACNDANLYVQHYLSSSNNLVGYHHYA